jgi:hypothetical protein
MLVAAPHNGKSQGGQSTNDRLGLAAKERLQ